MPTGWTSQFALEKRLGHHCATPWPGYPCVGKARALSVEIRETSMLNLKVADIRASIPAKDFAISKAFYTALGWKLTEITEKLALMELGEWRLHLQDYYVKEWAENSVIFIAVEDTQAWHDHISAALKERSYLDARVWPPKAEEWGALTTFAIDPSGVLIRFTQSILR